MSNAGNGWYRCTITGAFTGNLYIGLAAVDGVAVYTGNGTSGIFIYGAQLEAGSFATSYIPTVASTVTRSADVATMTGTNFSSWYNQSEGTFIANFDVLSTTGVSKTAIITNDGTSNNFNLIYVSSGAVVYAEARSGGVVQALLTAGNATANTVISDAFAYKANDFASTFNGITVQTDTSGAVALNQNALNIGYSSNFAGLYVNGHIRQIAYYNTRLPNAQLQTLTAPSLATTLTMSFTDQAYTVGV
jgi:hypothetical protein